MSSKTKILIIRSRSLILAGAIILIIVFAVILIVSLSSSDRNEIKPEADISQNIYTPGVYSKNISLAQGCLNLTVCFDRNHINSVSVTSQDDIIEAFYPLVPSVFGSITNQIISNQNVNNIVFTDDTRYTAELIIQAVSQCILAASSSIS